MRKIILGVPAGLLLLFGSNVRASSQGAGDLHLVPMDEIQVPVVEGNRADGTLQLKMVLVTQDAAAADRATASMPRLRASSVAAALEFARLYASPMLPVDVMRLSEDMTAAIHQQEHGVSKVLIVEVMARRV